MPENYHFAELATVTSREQEIAKDETYARALQAALQREAYANELQSYNADTGANRDAGRMPIEPSNINSMMEDGLIDGVEIDLGYTKMFVTRQELREKGFCRGTLVLYTCPCCINGVGYAVKTFYETALRCKFTSVITLAEIVVFVVTISIYGFTSPSNNNMIGPSSEAFLELGAKYTPYILNGQAWRLVVPIFLHAGVVHILANMYAQVVVGFSSETSWGSPTIAVIYFVSGLAGNIVSAYFSPAILSVGASGAILGVIGAEVAQMIATWQRTQYHLRMSKAKYLFVSLVILIIIGVIEHTNIDNLCHAGGFGCGFCMGLIRFNPDFESTPRKVIAGIFGAVGLVGIVTILVVLFVLDGRPFYTG
uniref:rhomboid protease n=1 Tax=Hanusia phi TaxID=3032 RepID=A0A7S0ES09_9CRYP|mmetsp:Transcript_29551/g.66867  ORF Transcript_29551/g.66867 Transcript_29551/m.66867 type:complete len:366 (+) Transcript_29551:165-1262(+)